MLGHGTTSCNKSSCPARWILQGVSPLSYSYSIGYPYGRTLDHKNDTNTRVENSATLLSIYYKDVPYHSLLIAEPRHTMASIPGPDHGPKVVALSIVMIVLPTIALALRIWSRLPKNQRFWWDDWFAIASLVCATIYLDHQSR